MSEGKRITFADIKRQMELASEDIETWPTWMRRAAGLDSEGPDYNTLRAENARLREAMQSAYDYITNHRHGKAKAMLFDGLELYRQAALQPKEPKHD